ncbi:hypothetical protein FOZ60_004856 [Perkinsus olseni]|uniref:Uncharacterized protein n=1 Tax=Perkinsus olseni TaxID=32597 RepID=A0A7J6PI04_PEROL|nr:hypothetical protein FOZ60_004856 [Perkinsus olseni]
MELALLTLLETQQNFTVYILCCNFQENMVALNRVTSPSELDREERSTRHTSRVLLTKGPRLGAEGSMPLTAQPGRCSKQSIHYEYALREVLDNRTRVTAGRRKSRGKSVKLLKASAVNDDDHGVRERLGSAAFYYDHKIKFTAVQLSDRSQARLIAIRCLKRVWLCATPAAISHVPSPLRSYCLLPSSRSKAVGVTSLPDQPSQYYNQRHIYALFDNVYWGAPIKYHGQWHVYAAFNNIYGSTCIDYYDQRYIYAHFNIYSGAFIKYYY